MAMTEPDERASVHLIDALTKVWSRIRQLHPQVPAVVIVAAPGNTSRGALGHFAPFRWRHRNDGRKPQHEVMVMAEYLDREALEVAGTLLHEAAHAVNFERAILDCSRNQYHNRAFKAGAEQLGLVVSQMRHYGFAMTRVPAETAKRYESEIIQLESALLHRDDPFFGVNTPKAAANRNRRATCECGYVIRVAKSTLEKTTVWCDSCRKPFKLDETPEVPSG